MEKSDLVKRLEALSFGTNLENLQAAEAQFGRRLSALAGWDAAAVAFERFFLETTQTFNVEIVPNVHEPVSHEIALFIEKLVYGFQTLRAARLAAMHGYPMQGYVLLRNIYDDCVLISAVAHRLTTFEALSGVKPGEPTPTLDEARRNRMEVEKRVVRQIDGTQSGLSARTRDLLRQLDSMYDMETHGGRLTTAHNINWLTGSAPLPIVPVFTQERIRLFVNRYSEVAWLVHRLLPLLQLPTVHFSNGWGEKWRTIDDAFSTIVMSLTAQLGKPVGAAYCEFVNSKFPFNERSHFPG